GIINVTGGTLDDRNIVNMNLGDTLDFELEATDPDLSNMLTVGTDFSNVLPGGTTSLNGSNPTTLHAHWASSQNDIGIYIFNVTVTDDACPISGKMIYSYMIVSGVAVPTTVKEISGKENILMQ